MGQLFEQRLLDSLQDADCLSHCQFLYAQEEAELVENYFEVLACKQELDDVSGVF